MSSNNNRVDIVVELKSFDKGGTPTSEKIVKRLAEYLKHETCNQILREWECKSEKPLYDWEIKMHPPQIIFTNVLDKISEVYIIELKEVFSHLVERDLGQEFYEKYNYYISWTTFIDAVTSTEYVNVRNLENEFPEIKGTFI